MAKMKGLVRGCVGKRKLLFVLDATPNFVVSPNLGTVRELLYLCERIALDVLGCGHCESTITPFCSLHIY